jgi:hypothetical protein
MNILILILALTKFYFDGLEMPEKKSEKSDNNLKCQSRINNK